VLKSTNFSQQTSESFIYFSGYWIKLYILLKYIFGAPLCFINPLLHLINCSRTTPPLFQTKEHCHPSSPSDLRPQVHAVNPLFSSTSVAYLIQSHANPVHLANFVGLLWISFLFIQFMLLLFIPLSIRLKRSLNSDSFQPHFCMPSTYFWNYARLFWLWERPCHKRKIHTKMKKLLVKNPSRISLIIVLNPSKILKMCRPTTPN